jgi:hypothetical protein
MNRTHLACSYEDAPGVLGRALFRAERRTVFLREYGLNSAE